MKTHPLSRRTTQSGYSLLLVVTFAGISLLVLASALNWCLTNATLNERSNQYFSTVAAAEAASEKVLASLTWDYQSQGESLVWANLGNYRELVPTEAESPVWAGFAFNDGQGNNAHTYVDRLANASYVPLQSQYQGLYGLASSYRVVSNARMLRSPYDIGVGLKQDLQLASIPVFQFAIFYSVSLEINPGPNMTVTGRVHGNQNIYMQPVNTLTFLSHVTAAGDLIKNKSPLDPTVRSLSNSKVDFKGEHDAKTSALTLPIGTNNSPDAVHAILEVPPATESPNSLMGKQRFYNKADVIVLVSNSSVTVKSGLANNFVTTVPSAEWSTFLTTSGSFYDKREGKTIKLTEIDVARLISWNDTNNTIQPAFGGADIRSLYVADFRPNTASVEYAIRVKNGQTLPDHGLTIATPNPLYVKGNYNAPASALGSANTTLTKPAALIGDSINILSTAWNDANSSAGIGSRTAGDTTVNAALLGGIVPSGSGSYSGGVENFPRFLENWNSRTLTYNGSMVVMFFSKIASKPWGKSDVYDPPTRKWAFDLNFLDPAKLPPCTPEVRALIRGEWTTVKTGQVTGI